MAQVPGLQASLAQYDSDKVKERDAGRQRLRDIFGNPQNLELFQESASRDGGEGWKILFGVLCGVVRKEKRLATRASASAQAERRLTDAIALVRWMAERSVHLLSRKPFLSLFQELTSTLVYGRSIFAPAALQYAKALRSLLSYPPHLAALEKSHWRILMAICWSAVLGDEINVEDGWDGVDGDTSMMEPGTPDTGSTEANGSKRPAGSSITQAAAEMVALIPILVASVAAPLVPPLPEPATGYHHAPSLGHAILIKISRFLALHASETMAHLPILRSLNIVLGELELNCRQDMINAGLKMLPQLVGMWHTRSRVIREQVVLAIRTILPFLLQKGVLDKDKTGVVRDSLERLLEHLPKEMNSRSGIEPLDVANLRLRLRRHTSDECFSTSVFVASVGFTAENALAWSVLELYADAVFRLALMNEDATYGTPLSAQRAPKRRRIVNTIDSILTEFNSSNATSKLLAIQVMAFGIHQHRGRLPQDMTGRMLESLINLLDDEHDGVQTWAFCCLALACAESLDGTTAVLGRVWAHAVRKVTSGATRGAAIAALSIIDKRMVLLPRIVSDLSAMVRSLDVQGPPYPYDSVCALLAEALRLIKEDVRLYNENVQLKVFDWLAKWDAVEGVAGKLRLDAVLAVDLLGLLARLCRIQFAHTCDGASIDYLPDSPVVSRIRYERMTAPLRDFIFRAELPSSVSATDHLIQTSAQEMSVDSQMVDRVVGLLERQLNHFLADWASADGAKASAPAAERVRRALDTCVLASMFWALCETRQIKIESDMLHKVVELLNLVSSVLAQTAAYQPTAHLLMWRAVEVLVTKPLENRTTWPILIRPDPVVSGIRSDLLPQNKTKPSLPESSEFDVLLLVQQAIWKNATLAPALRRLMKLAEQSTVGGNASASSQPTSQSHLVHIVEDDDFGEIRTADTDLMPSLKEATDGRMTTAALLDLHLLVRLRSTSLALDGEVLPVRDRTVLNAFLGAEGTIFIELGRAVVHAVEQDLLQFSEEALSIALDVFEDMLRSYGYSRDEGLIHLMLSLLKITTHIWLDIRDSCERVLHLVKALVIKSTDNQVPSWQCRLDIILFLDEYLDYDPAFTSWGQAGSQSMSHLGWGPLYSISEALVDRDARVRFRAVSTTAGLFYLDSLTRSAQYDFYTEAISKLPRETKHWDSFLTDLLFKLNVCVASTSVRTAALYHLYEVPMSTRNFDQHLQTGLDAVARRLGLAGVTALYVPHAVLITSSQLASDQSPLTIAPQLYGFSSRKEYAEYMLPILAPTLLGGSGSGHSTTFASLCDSIKASEVDVVTQQYSAVAALALGLDAAEYPAKTNGHGRQLVTRFAGHPTFDLKSLPEGLVGHQAVMIIVHLLVMLDIQPNWGHEVSSEHFDVSACGLDLSSYLDVVLEELEDTEAGSLDPRLSPEAVLVAINRVLEVYPSTSYAQICFNGLITLCHAINTTYLASEQLRFFRSIAFLAARFADGWANQLVPRLAVQESLRLLVQPGPVGRAALKLLQWSMGRTSGTAKSASLTDGSTFATQTPQATQILLAVVKEDDTWLVNTFAQLGAAYLALDKKAEDDQTPLAELVDIWIKDEAVGWEKKPAFKLALTAMHALWPPKLACHLHDPGPPTFASLVKLIEDAPSADVMKLCLLLAGSIDEGNFAANVAEFRASTFWLLKKRLGDVHALDDGLLAFLDLVYAASGQVEAPDADMRIFRDAQTAALKSEKLKKLPADLPPRISIVEQLVSLVSHTDVSLRHHAYQSLCMVREYCGQPGQSTLSGLSTPATRLLTLLSSASARVASPAVSLVDTMDSDGDRMQRADRPNEWISSFAAQLASSLSDIPFYAALPTILRSSSTVSHDLLPYLVHGLLTTKGGTASLTSEDLKTLQARSNRMGSTFESILREPTANREAKRVILDIVVYLRAWSPPWRTPALGYLRWMPIDPLVIAQQAAQCGSYATALQYLEVAFYDGQEGHALDLAQPDIQKVLYDIYSNADDPDGFYGIPSTDVLSGLERRLQHEGDHWRALGLNSAAFEATPDATRMTNIHALRDLQQLGFNRMAGSLVRSNDAVEAALDVAGQTAMTELLPELAWRTGDWDLPMSSDVRRSDGALLLNALRTVHRERDLRVAHASAGASISSSLQTLASLDPQRMADIKKSLANLLCLRETALWTKPDSQYQSRFREQSLADAMASREFEFSTAERLISTRQSLMSASLTRDTSASPSLIATVSQEQKACYLALSAAARRTGSLQTAFNAVIAVRQLPSAVFSSQDVQDELTQVLWDQAEHSLAIRTAEEMTGRLDRKKKEDGAKLAVMLGRIANWTSNAKLRSPPEVLALFEDATLLASSHQVSPAERARIAHDYAVFADVQQAALARDPEFERLRTFVSVKQTELSQSQISAPSNRRKSAASKVREQSEIEFEEDTAAVDRLATSQTTYIKTALRMFASALALTDDFDDSVVRLCSLWLEMDKVEDVNVAFARQLAEIASHKFLFLGPQLAARLDLPKRPTPFNDNLNGLMLRLSRQHPFHILYQVITLASGFTVSNNTKGARASDSGAEGRAPAADFIMKTLSTTADKKHPLAATAVKHMRLVVDAARPWCLWQETGKKSSRGQHDVPPDAPIRRLNNLSIPIPTRAGPVDPKGRYLDTPTLLRYSTHYQILGGIHRPKRMAVYDSNKAFFVELFKGEDEVRQDAVMEQVFEMSNRLLSRDRQAKQRALKFRTYTVIPLPDKTGILEFVGDGQGIGEWLKPSHALYRQGKDTPADSFRTKLDPIQQKKWDNPQMVTAWRELMANFKPVMHHFFTEKHKDPMAWFAMRLAYIRSVAVTSMVGWVLGIGDRHCSNIMIDKKTGELVHIDFGIVFEEGQRLRIPERVPFRLTNDIVDGLGIFGVDGTFRQCSQHTLRVLRESSDVIMTVLEVFKHDPLYAWAGDPEKLQRAQGGRTHVDHALSSTTAVEKADRVLSRIRQKLRQDLSVEYQVNQLVQDARNEDHLAKIFVGWQSWF